MVTIEELKNKYPVKDVAPYGSCIVVPGDEFDPDWEHYLAEQGFKCFLTDLEMKPVTLVRLKPAASIPTRKSGKTPLGYHWTPEEDQQLIQLAKQKLSFEEISKQLPGRTAIAVKNRIGRLEKRGLLPSHPRQKYKRREMPPSPSEVKEKVTDKDGLVKELLEGAVLLYPSHRRASAVLLREATKEMEKASP